MNVDVPKKVLNRKMRKRRHGAANKSEPPVKEPKIDEDSDKNEEDHVPNPDDKKDSADNRTIHASTTAKSSILTKVKFGILKDKVADRTLTKLEQMGFQFMTEIQSKAIQPLLEVCSRSHYFKLFNLFRAKTYWVQPKLEVGRLWLF